MGGEAGSVVISMLEKRGAVLVMVLLRGRGGEGGDKGILG